jgi:hypothetical protein
MLSKKMRLFFECLYLCIRGAGKCFKREAVLKIFAYQPVDNQKRNGG